MPAYVPKKWPRQARSKATFDAIIDAAARILRNGGYAELTTNRIAEIAGVSIGTLYEFFADKETIVAVLAERKMAALGTQMYAAFERARQHDAWRGVQMLAQEAVAGIVADRAVYHALLRQIPFVADLPAVVASREAMTSLAQQIRVAAGDALSLPSPEQDTWLIAQMLLNTILEIGFLDVDEEERAALTRSLARLTYRMAVGRDPLDVS